MVTTIYIIILSYFIVGGLGFYFINRRKSKEVARQSWIKFISYFFIIHILFFSIVIQPVVFRYLAGTIAAMGFIELFLLFKKAQFKRPLFFLVSMFIYAILITGFITFSAYSKELILFSFLILSIFDAFSQISGQLFGKTKIAPKISPNKTIEGTVGGALIAVSGALLMNDLYEATWLKVVFLATGIVVFAYFGDIAASLFKRKFEVKDYSKLIPGHGGFLDRFDSLIAGGFWVAVFTSVLPIV